MTRFQPQIITFDADDTLWDFGKMLERGSQAVSERLAQDYQIFLSAAELMRREEAYLATQDPDTVDYVAARRVVYGRVLAESGHPDSEALADKLLSVYLQARNSRYEFFPDAHSTLEALTGRYILGWITNGTTLPHMAGLSEYFQFVISPATLGVRKPDPSVFLHAAQLGGAPIGALLHVGDSYEADVLGALQAGALAVWYNPFNHRRPQGIGQPHAEIKALAEVLNLVGG